MNICIRVDSSVDIGTGHVYRCLTLAEQFKKKGGTVTFAHRLEKGHLTALIEEKGFEVIHSSVDESFNEHEDASHFCNVIRERRQELDWVIVDHYQISSKWERYIINKLAVDVAVIDDLANRPHDCDLLLDQNYFADFKVRYQGLVPTSCKKLLGPAYLILRPEFHEVAGKELVEDNRLLIFFGGSDPTNETEKALKALANCQLRGWIIDVVVGTANPNRQTIERMAKKLDANYHCQINYIADLMKKATFSLGAGGVTMWERCYVGLPSFVTIVAENQRLSTEDAACIGAIGLLGWHEEIQSEEYERAIRLAITNRDILESMREKGKVLIQREQQTMIHPFVSEIMKRNS